MMNGERVCNDLFNRFPFDKIIISSGVPVIIDINEREGFTHADYLDKLIEKWSLEPVEPVKKKDCLCVEYENGKWSCYDNMRNICLEKDSFYGAYGKPLLARIDGTNFILIISPIKEEYLDDILEGDEDEEGDV